MGKGTGDLYIKGICGIIFTEIYVQDSWYYNDGSSVSSLEIGSGAICTSNGSYITLTTNTSGEKDVKLPVTLTGDWEFTTDIAELGTNQDLTFKVGSGSQWGAVDHSANRITVNLGNGSNYYTKTISKGDTLKVTYINGTMSVYWNDEYLTSRTVSISGKMGYYQVNGRTYHIKNIKLKPL